MKPEGNNLQKLNIELLFLEEYNFVVCKGCKDKHFPKLHAKTYRERGECQAFFSTCKSTDMSKYALFAEIMTSESPTKTEIPISDFNPDVQAITQLYPKRHDFSRSLNGEIPVRCEHKFFSAALFFKVQPPREKHFEQYQAPSITDLKENPSLKNYKHIFIESYPDRLGIYSHLERLCNTLNTLSNKIEKEGFKRELEQDLMDFVSTFIQGTVPYSSTINDFLEFTNFKNRNIYLKNLRKQFLEVAGDEIDSILNNLVEVNFIKGDYEYLRLGESLIYLLDPNSLMLIAAKFFNYIGDKNNISTLEDPQFYDIVRFIMVRVIGLFRDPNSKLDVGNTKRFKLSVIEMLKTQPKMFKILKEVDEIQKTVEKQPELDFSRVVENQEEMINASQRLNFLMKAHVYGEIGFEETIEEFSKVFDRFKKALKVTFDVKSTDALKTYNSIESSMSSSDKTLLLLNTPVVHTLVTACEFFDFMYFDDEDEEVVNRLIDLQGDLVSILNELSSNCFEITVLCLKLVKTHRRTCRKKSFSNFSTLFEKNSISRKSMHLAKLSGILFERALRFYPDSSELTEILISINLDPELWQKDLDRGDYYNFAEYLVDFKETLSTFDGPTKSLDELLEIQTNKDFVRNLPFHLHIKKCQEIDIGIEYKANQLGSNDFFKKIQLFSIEDLTQLSNSVAVNQKSLFDISVYSLNKNANLALNKLGISLTRSIFKAEILRSDMPIDLNQTTGEQNGLCYNYQTNLSASSIDLIYFLISYCSEAWEKTEDIKEKLPIYQKLILIYRRYKGQVDADIDTLMIEAFIDFVKALCTDSNVEFESEEVLMTAENIANFKIKGNKVILPFSLEEPKDEHSYRLENPYFKPSSNDKMPVEEFKSESLLPFFSDLEDNMKRRFVGSFCKNLNNLDLDMITRMLDIVSSFVADKEVDAVYIFEEVKPYFPQFVTLLLRAFSQFFSTFGFFDKEALNDAYYSIIVKIIRILRNMVDFNRTENRKFIWNCEFDLNFKVTIGKAVKLFDKNKKMNIFGVLNMLINYLLKILKDSISDNSNKLCSSHNTLEELLNRLFNLASEILEGAPSKTISSFIEDATNPLQVIGESSANSSMTKILGIAESFYLKLYDELNIDSDSKNRIENFVDSIILANRILSIGEIDDNVQKIINSKSGKEVEELLDYYHSDPDRQFYNHPTTKKCFEAFTYLKYKNKQAGAFASINPNSSCGRIFEFFESVTKKVEINVRGISKIVFFLIHPDFNLLRQNRKKLFLDTVNRESEDSKKSGILEYGRHLGEDIKYMQSNGLMTGWKKSGIDFPYSGTLFGLLILSVINLILVFSSTASETSKMTDGARATFDTILGIQIAIAFCTLALWFTTKFRLESHLALAVYRANKSIDEKEMTLKHKVICIGKLILFSTDSIALALIVCLNVAMLSEDSLYWMVSIHMFFFSEYSENLRNVIYAVRMRSKQLLLLSLFMVFMLTLYGLLTFVYMKTYFATEDGDMLCNTPMHCLTNQFDFGLRMGGGMGDNMPVIEWDSQNYWTKFVYSITHYIIFPIVILNIVAGIIIDTFADLREKTSEIDYDRKNICLVCGKNRDQINREEGSFNSHITNNHRVFDYMAYIFYIDRLDSEETNFYEGFVKEKIDNEEIDWMPQSEEKEEDPVLELKNNFEEKIENLKQELISLKKKKNIVSNPENQLPEDEYKHILNIIEEKNTETIQKAYKSASNYDLERSFNKQKRKRNGRKKRRSIRQNFNSYSNLF